MVISFGVSSLFLHGCELPTAQCMCVAGDHTIQFTWGRTSHVLSQTRLGLEVTDVAAYEIFIVIRVSFMQLRCI